MYNSGSFIISLIEYKSVVASAAAASGAAVSVNVWVASSPASTVGASPSSPAASPPFSTCSPPVVVSAGLLASPCGFSAGLSTMLSVLLVVCCVSWLASGVSSFPVSVCFALLVPFLMALAAFLAVCIAFIVLYA